MESGFPTTDATWNVVGAFARLPELTVLDPSRLPGLGFTGEYAHRTQVMDADGRPVLAVEERFGAAEVISRLILGKLRPFQVQLSTVESPDAVGLTITRKFRPWGATCEVRAADAELMGTVKSRSSLFRYRYLMRHASTGEELAAEASVIQNRRFVLDQYGLTVGSIEATAGPDGTGFHIEMGELASPDMRALVLSTGFLVHVAHFERSRV